MDRHNVPFILLALSVASIAGCLDDSPSDPIDGDLAVSNPVPAMEPQVVFEGEFTAVGGMPSGATFEVPESQGRLWMYVELDSGTFVDPAFSVGDCIDVSPYGGAGVWYLGGGVTLQTAADDVPFDCGEAEAGEQEVTWAVDTGYLEGRLTVYVADSAVKTGTPRS